MKNSTTGCECAPIFKPWREHTAWGRISPSRRMAEVAIIRPMTPVVTSANTIDIALLTRVFPRSRVHSRRLPFLRRGMIFLAYSCSLESPAFSTIFSENKSRESRPRVSPLNKAERGTNRQARRIASQTGSPLEPCCSKPHPWSCKQALKQAPVRSVAQRFKQSDKTSSAIHL